MQQEFSNRTALIVGGSSGMGKATAKQLLQAGARWVAIIGSSADKLEAAKEELSAFGELKTFTANLYEWEEVQDTIAFVKELQQTDLLVNAAGVFVPKSFVEHTLEDYNKYMDINKATFFITQQAVKNMIANN